MNRAMTIALLCCVSLAGGLSCSRKEPGKEAPNARAVGDAAEEVPEIPIDVMPKLLSAPINYPEEARSRGEEGIVYVKALVGKDGKVTQAVLDPQKPASELLGKAAVEAVTRWSFEPARAKDKPVAVWIVVPVNFKLR